MIYSKMLAFESIGSIVIASIFVRKHSYCFFFIFAFGLSLLKKTKQNAGRKGEHSESKKKKKKNSPDTKKRKKSKKKTNCFIFSLVCSSYLTIEIQQTEQTKQRREEKWKEYEGKNKRIRNRKSFKISNIVLRVFRFSPFERKKENFI